MRIIKRLSAVALSGAVVGALLSVPPATAVTRATGSGTTEAFAGSASATALNLTLLGIKLTVSQTHASADSSPKAHGDASVVSGTVLTLGVTKADAPVAANLTSTTPQPCNLDVPLQGILSIKGLCSQSAAAVPTGAAPAACSPSAATVAPTACGLASVLDIDVNLVEVLKPLLDAIKGTVAGVDQTVGQLLTSLPVVTPLLQGLLQAPVLSGLGVDLAKPVSSLVDAIERATELLRIRVLPSASVVATTPGSVVAASESEGIEIDVLPNLTLNHGPLLSIVVAKGSAASTYNRTTCQSSATFGAALVAVRLLDSPINVGLGGLTLPGALGSIVIGGGNTSQNADGSVGAVADGLRIHLLGDAIDLDVAHAESVAGGSCSVVIPTTTTSTTAPQTTTTPPTNAGKLLALTGPEQPLLPIGFFLILAGYLTRRAVKSRR